MNQDNQYTVDECIDELKKMYLKLEEVEGQEPDDYIKFVLGEALSQIDEATVSLNLAGNHTEADKIVI